MRQGRVDENRAPKKRKSHGPNVPPHVTDFLHANVPGFAGSGLKRKQAWGLVLDALRREFQEDVQTSSEEDHGEARPMALENGPPAPPPSLVELQSEVDELQAQLDGLRIVEGELREEMEQLKYPMLWRNMMNNKPMVEALLGVSPALFREMYAVVEDVVRCSVWGEGSDIHPNILPS
jgi:hypothetical protein